MKTIYVFALIIFCSACDVGGHVRKKTIVYGVVTDRSTGKPIENISVSLRSGPVGAVAFGRTDVNGNFNITANDFELTLRFGVNAPPGYNELPDSRYMPIGMNVSQGKKHRVDVMLVRWPSPSEAHSGEQREANP